MGRLAGSHGGWGLVKCKCVKIGKLEVEGKGDAIEPSCTIKHYG